MTTTAETGLCERLANEAYLAKSAAHALQLAMRGSSLQGQERETLLELAESTAARSACLSERLDEESKTGDAAFAASRAAPVSGRALTRAFIQCDATRQAVARHEGPDDLPEALVDAESAALMALAVTPCEIRDIPAKLRHLILNHWRAHGDALWQTASAPEIMAALDFHFGKGWTERETAEAAKTWPAHAGADDEGAKAGAVERVEA